MNEEEFVRILCRNGMVWAEVVDDGGADTLQPLISKKVTAGSIICSDAWKHTPASLREDTSTVSLITAKNSTAIEKEIISMVWRDSGDT